MTDLPTRISSRIRVDGECWTWTGAKNPDGYGRVFFGRGYRMAHRVVYETLVGAIAPGLQTDHLCRNRSCVRPSHLELVTSRENIIRGTNPAGIAMSTGRCAHGHALTGANLKIRIRDGLTRRECRTCRRERGRINKQNARLRAKAISKL